MAYVLINTEIGGEREVLKKLKNTDGVLDAYGLTGIYDIIAKVKADSPEKLMQVINDKLVFDKVHSKLTVVVSDN